jgi:hypothetical protein
MEYTHHIKYCDICEEDTAVCGKCGNNCCNGGVGEIIGPNPGELIKCDACNSAYELHNQSNKVKITSTNKKE